MQIFSTER
jgi:hypothetical protein